MEVFQVIYNSIDFDVKGHTVRLESFVEEGAVGKDAVLVFPGGGYMAVCHEREGAPIAKAFYDRGFNAFVLHYAVGEQFTYPSQLIDASFGVTYLKAHSAELGINPDRIFTVGFSAGGHLSGSVAILHKDPLVLDALGIRKGDNKPCGSILCYPVVSANVPTHEGSFAMLAGKPFAKIGEDEKLRLSLECNVDEDSAPVFIWHTSEDTAVPMLGSLRLAEAYHSINRAVSLHLYPYGVHGLALSNAVTSVNGTDYIEPLAEAWVDESVRWIKTVKSY